jgi:hypothetical protein
MLMVEVGQTWNLSSEFVLSSLVIMFSSPVGSSQNAERRKWKVEKGFVPGFSH